MKRKSHSNRALLIIIIILLAVAGIIGGIKLRDYILKIQYPLEYESYIVKYSDEYGLDPYFVCALIDTESGFDPQALSDAGAQGLMQIMPETADWIAEKLNTDIYDINAPETNIEFGCWYLSYLFDRFDDVNVVIASYNAGPNRVEEWLTQKYSSDGITLDEIPYEETDNYVDKVTKAYDKYKELYEIS